MKTCEICKQPIPNMIYVNGKQQLLQSRKNCLDCVPFKSRKRTKRPSVELTCQRCDKKYLFIRGHGFTKKHCSSCSVKRRQRKLKEKMVQYKGGKCEICGYNKCNRALQFHHIDPNTKLVNLSVCIANNSRWTLIETELNKCQLLCANCHSELEDSKYKVFSD